MNQVDESELDVLFRGESFVTELLVLSTSLLPLHGPMHEKLDPCSLMVSIKFCLVAFEFAMIHLPWNYNVDLH